MEAKIIVILGPTCTGKTSLALKLCKLFGGIIVSADSRQVVRHMDVGTGKVPIDKSNSCIKRLNDHWLIDDVKIYGYDLVNPDEFFSAYDFACYFKNILYSPNLHKGVVFLVGGTGFYIDVALGRVKIEGSGPDLALRESLQNLTLQELQIKLADLDKKTYENIDLSNKVRIIRAIEKLCQMSKDHCANIPINSEIKPHLIIGLTAPRDFIYEKADNWLESVFGFYLFEEVKNIQNLYPNAFRLKGLIYKSALDYMQNPSYDNFLVCKQRAKYDLHGYIRRQQTYFKKIPNVHWFYINDENFDEKAGILVESALNE